MYPSLHITDPPVEEDHFQSLINKEFLWSQINDLFRTPQGCRHFVHGLTESDSYWVRRSFGRRWRWRSYHGLHGHGWGGVGLGIIWRYYRLNGSFDILRVRAVQISRERNPPVIEAKRQYRSVLARRIALIYVVSIVGYERQPNLIGLRIYFRDKQW